MFHSLFFSDLVSVLLSKPARTVSPGLCCGCDRPSVRVPGPLLLLRPAGSLAVSWPPSSNTIASLPTSSSTWCISPPWRCRASARPPPTRCGCVMVVPTNIPLHVHNHHTVSFAWEQHTVLDIVHVPIRWLYVYDINFSASSILRISSEKIQSSKWFSLLAYFP